MASAYENESGYNAFLARGYQLQGRRAEALDNCEKAIEKRPEDAFLMGFVGFVYAQLGHEQEALEVADMLAEKGDQTYYDVAVIHAGLGNTERAFAAWTDVDCNGKAPSLRIEISEPVECAKAEYSSDRRNANVVAEGTADAGAPAR